MPTVKTEGARLSDVLRWTVRDEYCIEQVTIDKAVATEIGTPLDLNGSNGNAGLIANGSEASCDAIALEKTAAVAGATHKCLALVRGPAEINGDALALQANVTKSELVAPLKAIGVLVRDQPTKITST